MKTEVTITWALPKGNYVMRHPFFSVDSDKETRTGDQLLEAALKFYSPWWEATRGADLRVVSVA
jgi:hypothetical protein